MIVLRERDHGEGQVRLEAKFMEVPCHGPHAGGD